MATKKSANKKKPLTKEKVAPKKAAPKKTAPKKPLTKKKVAPKKAAPKKTAPKKPLTKKKVVPKKAAPKKILAEKKPTKTELKKEKERFAREEKKKKRIDLLNKRSSVDFPVNGITPYTIHRGESYMSPKQMEHFRNILLRWKRELLDEVSRMVDHIRKDASNFADPADRATQEEEFSLELRTRDRESKLVRKINRTLKTIDLDEYGYCESCGVAIGIKRLEARPTATLCIDCKTLQEIKEKQMFT